MGETGRNHGPGRLPGLSRERPAISGSAGARSAGASRDGCGLGKNVSASGSLTAGVMMRSSPSFQSAGAHAVLRGELRESITAVRGNCVRWTPNASGSA